MTSSTSSEEDIFRCDFDLENLQTRKSEHGVDNLTVKFYTTDAKVFTQYFPNFYNIGFVKTNLAHLFGIPREIINLLYKEEPIDDGARLEMLKPDRYGILEFKLGSNDKNHKIPIENAYKDMTVPDILTIRIEKDGEVNDVVVEVENRAIEKPYIGGYKDAHTDILYHHGYTQTGPPKPKVPPELKNHRDTQTYFTRNRRTEQDYSRATQVTTKGIYVPNACDRILTPGPYETADEREKRINIEGKVRTIQRYYRAWMMRKKLKEFSDEYQKRLRIALEREEKERVEDAKRRKKDLVDKVFPVKTEDFAMLYSMVDRWKKSEIERITSMHCGPSKIAEFYLLLEKEIEIIQSIERLRTKVNKDVEKKQIIDFFKAIGSPIEWDSDYKHIHISMDTMEAQKGREYFRLYQRLCDQKSTKEDRLQTYLDIKLYLNTHKCNERQEIVSLIDRMCEFLARGMSESSLKVLQKRIEALILHHFKMTECNEGVTSHPNKLRIKQMTKNLIYCQMCQKMKAIEKFTINARSERIKICTACMWLDKAEEPWVDLSPYKFILRQIRNYERLHHGTSSIAFIMQDRDIQFIVTVIWHGHSALSECADVYQLRLVRWDTEQEWSPWNCILLTMEEAKAHLRLDRLTDIYEQEFRNHIFNKHALARKHFKNLSSYDKHFTEFSKGDWKLDEWSDYYSRPNKHECDIEIDENKGEEGEGGSNSNDINSEEDDECTCKKILEKSINSEEQNE